jgi:hypothetical protein
MVGVNDRLFAFLYMCRYTRANRCADVFVFSRGGLLYLHTCCAVHDHITNYFFYTHMSDRP